MTAAALQRPIDFYNEEVVRKFTLATIFWGVVAFTVGVVIALQLAFPELNLGLPWTTFGRLRPVHTSAAIFAFGGNALFATSLFVVQRTCRTPLFGGPALADFIFWSTFHRIGRVGLCARHHRRARIRRAGMVCRSVVDGRLGRLSGRIPGHHHQAP